MIVFNPNNATQTISFIPRLDYNSDVNITIINEFTKTEFIDLIQFNASFLLDGIVTFNELEIEDISNGNKYSIKIEDAKNNILFRGQAIATTQETQEYKDTKDVYIYE